MEVLVTGSTGFIGTHLVERLLRSGTNVRALVRDPSKARHLESNGAGLVQGCLEDAESLRRAAANVCIVYHLAGRISGLTRESFLQSNTSGTRAMLQAAAAQPNPPVVVLVSSLAAAGPSPPGRARVETDSCQTVSHYGQSKREAEIAAHPWADRVPITIVRPPIVYGPGDRATLGMFRSLSWGLHVDPTRKGSRFSLVHVEDLVQGLVAAAEQGKRISTNPSDGQWPGYYYLCGAESPTYMQLGATIANAVGRRRWIGLRPPAWTTKSSTWMQDALFRALGRTSIVTRDKIREATAGSWWCSADRAKEEFGFVASTSFEDGTKGTVRWYREQGWL